ncbi:monooxygenase [Beutenbergia cavernae DSM 12333]|uniref:Monooxygenase n=1 Tax=Beutenbergia cavernae (strain ATCC BAA-8 / DSM 12333 / CCUG 43141 / JCM 11478 / NBRC 16432 / NCIMB 13614 / HKI 0122) TaxID=471853 RepID=C5C4S0_BEUC1|nr:NtaA/DmoA family FMN-dependent monooxygenase [Beutenbergia cavernae]ACQ80048.1 monooxygenase [Beutenbergia cavernae DSM 12333]
MPEQIRLSLFEMAAPVHLSHGMWTHPRDQRHRIHTVEFWTELGQILEEGTFDLLFLADVLGTYDVFTDGLSTAVKEAFQVPTEDPLIVLGALASATRDLGLAATFSTTYEPPFTFARRLSTLDHLSNGRVAWNIVTSYLANAARNFGLTDQVEHDLRYEIADEYLTVLYRLWQDSWRDDAVVVDRAARVYTDPAKVDYINHVGDHFSVAGPHLSAPSPQRTPVLFQAGSSIRGREFAARHAEVVFVGGGTKEKVRSNIADIRARAVEAGRDPAHLAFLAIAKVIVGRTEQEAWDKANAYDSYRTPREALEQPRRTPELSRYAPTHLIADIIAAKDFGYEMLIRNFEPGQTVADVLALQSRSRGGEFTVVGSPVQVADALERWTTETGVDGFNIKQDVSFDSVRDFVDLVVPVLRDRGLLRDRYTPGETLRERLFGAGQRQPHETHPALAEQLARTAAAVR